MSGRVEDNRIVSRRDFIKFAAVTGASAVFAGCRGLRPKEYPTVFSGELSEFLQKYSGPLLKGYTTVEQKTYETDREVISGPAVWVRPPKPGILSVPSAFFFQQGSAKIALFPQESAFDLDIDTPKLTASTSSFAAAVIDGGILHSVKLDEVSFDSATVGEMGLFGNIYPGLNREEIENYWPETRYSTYDGWFFKGKWYHGYDLEPGAVWEPEDKGDVYAIQLREAGRRFLKDQSS
jgi:hypothetical protein